MVHYTSFGGIQIHTTEFSSKQRRDPPLQSIETTTDRNNYLNHQRLQPPYTIMGKTRVKSIIKYRTQNHQRQRHRQWHQQWHRQWHQQQHLQRYRQRHPIDMDAIIKKEKTKREI